MKNKVLILLLGTVMCSMTSIAQDKISGQWYIGFAHNEEANQNQFHLKRAYISYKKQITPWLKGRITPDITIDKEGDGKGDVELRMKYLYLQFKLKDFWIFTGNSIYAGLTPRPWIDYEQDIISYRAQGHMFLERTKVINSTDFGINFNTSIGEKFDCKEYKTACPGKYGHLAIGVFNGGGYNKLEENKNKTIEWKLTSRPLPKALPGLLLTYHGAFGEGNSNRHNAFELHGLHLGYEHKYFIAAGQVYQGVGNYKDSYLNEYDNSPYKHNGYSVFGEIRHPKTGLSIWARYDSQNKDFNFEQTDYTEERLILSAVYRFYKNNKIIFSRDNILKGLANQPETIWEATLDIRF